jgi:hypothetical protein
LVVPVVFALVLVFDGALVLAVPEPVPGDVLPLGLDVLPGAPDPPLTVVFVPAAVPPSGLTAWPAVVGPPPLTF